MVDPSPIHIQPKPLGTLAFSAFPNLLFISMTYGPVHTCHQWARLTGTQLFHTDVSCVPTQTQILELGLCFFLHLNLTVPRTTPDTEQTERQIN
jgi:hypothetical protein